MHNKLRLHNIYFLMFLMKPIEGHILENMFLCDILMPVNLLRKRDTAMLYESCDMRILCLHTEFTVPGIS